MGKNLLTVLILTVVFNEIVFADQYVFANDNTSSVSSNNVRTNIDLNRTFMTFNEAVAKLNSLGYFCTVVNNNQSDPTNQQINYSGETLGLVKVIAQKFNYTTTINGTNVVFKAIYPPIPKPLIESVLLVNNLQPLAITTVKQSKPIVEADNWEYSINDKYISSTLNKWAKQAGYQLVWKSDNDYEVQSTGVIVGGSFKAAVNDVLSSFRTLEHPLKAEWYKNKVVVISNFGE